MLAIGTAPKLGKAEIAALIRRAEEAGAKAGADRIPEPMHVIERANPWDDRSPIVKRYAPIEGGVCGFAWITVRPGNSPVANYLKNTGKGRTDSYAGGVMVWVSQYGQSMERKVAYAYAYASVLRDAGVKAYAGDRMD